MTGAILRRLREAAGIPRKALVAHGAQAAMVASLEDCGVSRAKPEHWERKRASWCRYLDALRAAKKAQIAAKSATSAANASGSHPLSSPQNIALQKAIEAVSEKPAPEAMRVERDGVREWVKVVEYADGRKYGFVWRDGDWYRAAWVEERFLGRKVTPRFAEGDEAYPDAGLAGWRNGY